MTDINVLVVQGRLTRDIGADDFAYLPNGTARLNFSIAVNRSVKKGDEWTDEVSYFDVTHFGKSAEAIKPKLHKGSLVTIDGYIKQDRWKSKTGENRSAVKIVADMVRHSEGGGQHSAPQQQSAPAPEPVTNPDGFPEDIPF